MLDLRVGRGWGKGGGGGFRNFGISLLIAAVPGIPRL